MPKISRYRIGNQIHKKIRNTRKIRGGSLVDLKNSIQLDYKCEVEVLFFMDPNKSFKQFFSYMAKARAHVEKSIVDNMIDLVNKMILNLNDPLSVSCKEIEAKTEGTTGFTATQALIKARDNYKVPLPDNIKLSNVMYENPNRIMSKIKQLYTQLESKSDDDSKSIVFNYENADGAGSNTHSKLYEKRFGAQLIDETDPHIPFEGEFFMTTNNYIPEIIDCLDEIYKLFKGKTNKTKNKINVTAQTIGELLFNNMNKSQDDLIANPLLLEKLKGGYEIINFFDNDTYLAFEKRLKLIHVLESFESYYIKFANIILQLPDDLTENEKQIARMKQDVVVTGLATKESSVFVRPSTGPRVNTPKEVEDVLSVVHGNAKDNERKKGIREVIENINDEIRAELKRILNLVMENPNKNKISVPFKDNIIELEKVMKINGITRFYNLELINSLTNLKITKKINNTNIKHVTDIINAANGNIGLALQILDEPYLGDV